MSELESKRSHAPYSNVTSVVVPNILNSTVDSDKESKMFDNIQDFNSTMSKISKPPTVPAVFKK